MNIYEILIEYTEPQQILLTVQAETPEAALTKLEQNVTVDYEVLQVSQVATDVADEEVASENDTIPNPTSNTLH